MPHMKPLGEWICDSCGKITDARGGGVEWLSGSVTTAGPHSFRIVHHLANCYRHIHAFDRADLHITAFIGAPGLQRFLSMLDPGPLISPSAEPDQPEMRSFVDTVRRLHIPYYEEARQYMAEAQGDGYFEDQTEVSIFLPETCKAIIARYGSAQRA
jgi:hypothetical protein